MRTSKVLIAAAIAALAILSVGCKKHSFREIVPGEQIRFRAVNNVDSQPLDVKTVYSGKYFTVGSGSSSRTFEHIDWVVGDKLSIGYVSGSATGLRAEYWDYDVTGATSPDRDANPEATSLAYLTPSGGNGLVWRDATTHIFRAMYPNVPDDSRFRFEVENGEIVYNLPCLYPIRPVLIRKGETNTYVEDMKYAWMLASDDGTIRQAEDPINLLFDMHFTAFEITFDSAEAEQLEVNSVSLSDANNPIVGDFVYSEDSAHNISDVDGDEVSKTVTAFFNDAHDPITLTKGSPVTVVIFTSCAHPKHAMTLSFSLQNGTETINRSIKLATVAANLEPDENDQFYYGISFGDPYKHVITGIEIPLTLTEDDPWFAATGNAGSYNHGTL